MPQYEVVDKTKSNPSPFVDLVGRILRSQVDLARRSPPDSVVSLRPPVPSRPTPLDNPLLTPCVPQSLTTAYFILLFGEFLDELNGENIVDAVSSLAGFFADVGVIAFVAGFFMVRKQLWNIKEVGRGWRVGQEQGSSLLQVYLEFDAVRLSDPLWKHDFQTKAVYILP